MSVGVLRRYAVPVSVALPIALAGLALGDGGLPVPFQPDASAVHTVTSAGGLGIHDLPPDPRIPDPSDLSGAHPVTYPVGTSAVRQAAAREEAPGPDTSDLALPARVLQAYQSAARDLRSSDASCHLDWPLLAGIGKVESGHAYGGEVDRHGDTLVPILGPVLDGGPGVAAIPDTDGGRWDTDDTWDRAVGPMQFIPSTWSIHGADGNSDGKQDPNNVNDASLASGDYLCADGRDVSIRKQRRAAVFSYNHSWDYVDLVLAWADAYAGGTPVLTGSLAMAIEDPLTKSEDTGSGTGPDSGAGSGDATPGVTPTAPASAAPVAEPTASADPGAGPADPTPEPTASSDPAPSPDPTPAGSTTPEPTREPCPSGTATPSPTGSTATPTDSPTAEPSPTPTDTATPDPSGTATPDPTPTC